VGILDWVLLSLMTFFFIRGLFRGFLLEIFEIIAIIAGFVVVQIFGSVFGLFLTNHTPIQRGWAGILAAGILFLVAVVAVGITGRLLRKLIRAASLGWIDRFAGSLVGLLKSIILILILMLIVGFLPLSKSVRSTINKGQVSGIFCIGAQWVLDMSQIVPISPNRVMADYLRSYGLDDEIVHIVTDQPGLMKTILTSAPADINIPVKSILKGEPATKMPSKLSMPKDLSKGLVEVFENPKLSDNQKAEIFWTLIQKAQDK